MGAYNWILITHRCPNCSEQVDIRCQTHIASSYQGTTKRFHNEIYRLGEKLRWWPTGHPDFEQWRVNGCVSPCEDDPLFDRECCYSECLSCGAELYIVIRFKQNLPLEVLLVSKEWPENDYQ
ncbi:MAG: hypothetical protein DRR08_32125 [Candidatus Parabeggiatoa sp. nov. 2]|nr:MAG: hypothetical protein B6247_30840 [Beggiatoa sp. 4572_84]RKZ47830.1 MAG: hypothetical protein DRR08_32125 [Gammaproteobacteria bacterium]